MHIHATGSHAAHVSPELVEEHKTKRTKPGFTAEQEAAFRNVSVEQVLADRARDQAKNPNAVGLSTEDFEGAIAEAQERQVSLNLVLQERHAKARQKSAELKTVSMVSFALEITPATPFEHEMLLAILQDPAATIVNETEGDILKVKIVFEHPEAVKHAVEMTSAKKEAADRNVPLAQVLEEREHRPNEAEEAEHQAAIDRDKAVEADERKKADEEAAGIVPRTKKEPAIQ
jgi:hypothetical protein